MASPSLTAADTARLAHRVLRLRENGVDSERDLRGMAARAPAARVFGVSDKAAQEVKLFGDAGAELALEVVKTLEPALPGPTDRNAVERLMGLSLTDIHKAWDDAVTANLEATLPDAELTKWRRSVERDRKRHDERMAAMAESGDTFDVHPAFGHERHTDGAANALYDLGRGGILSGAISVTVATIKVILVDSADYAVNLATHEFLSSVAAAGRVATSPALANKTTTAGVFDADDAALGNVSGDPSEALVIVQSSAVAGGADVADTAQRLIGYIDTATGLPVTPNGGAISVLWDSGSNRIFKL